MRRNEILRGYSFNRRAFIFGAAQGIFTLTLGARLYQLQVVESKKYKTLADENRIRLIPFLPPRGRIIDRTGVLLAEGSVRHQVLYDPLDKNRNAEILELLKEYLNLSPERVKEIEEEVKAQKHNSPIVVSDYLPWESVLGIEVNATDLPGVFINTTEIRHYPLGTYMPHLMGYVAKPNEKDVEEDPFYKQPSFHIGKDGLERTFEKRLRGKPGVRRIEVNAHGNSVRELSSKKSVTGQDLNISLHAGLQQKLVELLAGHGGLVKESGIANVIHIPTGQILATGSVPVYDPNVFVRGITSKEWKELRDNHDAPLSNKAIVAQYPPGSTFKIVTALAALNSGLVKPSDTVNCPGYFWHGGRRFHCWQKEGHGNVNLVGAIKKSCNVYFYAMGRKIGIRHISDTAKLLGLGEKTGIELPGEKAGIIPSEEWKRKTRGQPWYSGETLNTSIGQGYVLTTPLQLAQMVARVASGGRNIKATLLMPEKYDPLAKKSEELQEKQDSDLPWLSEKETPWLKDEVTEKIEIAAERLPISEESIKYVLEGMNRTVNDPEGVVYKRRIEEPEYAMAGKTGTAQVISKRFDDVPAERSQKHHSLFIGYAPVHNPTYAVSVVIEHGGFGSAIAAPIAKELLLYAQKNRIAEG